MEPLVALIAEQELIIVILHVLATDAAGHIVQFLLPLLSGVLSGPHSQIAFASGSPTEAFGKGGMI